MGKSTTSYGGRAAVDFSKKFTKKSTAVGKRQTARAYTEHTQSVKIPLKVF